MIEPELEGLITDGPFFDILRNPDWHKVRDRLRAGGVAGSPRARVVKLGPEWPACIFPSAVCYNAHQPNEHIRPSHQMLLLLLVGLVACRR
jgi:hypothetical protein